MRIELDLDDDQTDVSIYVDGSIICRSCGTLLPVDVVHEEAVRETLSRGASVICELCQSGEADHVHP